MRRFPACKWILGPVGEGVKRLWAGPILALSLGVLWPLYWSLLSLHSLYQGGNIHKRLQQNIKTVGHEVDTILVFAYGDKELGKHLIDELHLLNYTFFEEDFQNIFSIKNLECLFICFLASDSATESDYRGKAWLASWSCKKHSWN